MVAMVTTTVAFVAAMTLGHCKLIPNGVGINVYSNGLLKINRLVSETSEKRTTVFP